MDVPDEARYLFEDAGESHPFLDSVIGTLTACAANDDVAKHLQPGALKAELGALHDVCDDTEAVLLAIALLALALLPLSVAAAAMPRRPTAGSFM